MQYQKHFIPLESDPALFTELIHKLGLSDALAFHDVFSLEDPDMLALVPRPALALILLFPTTDAYEKSKADDRRPIPNYDKKDDPEAVMWYMQTIHNACGLYGILHAISNGEARRFAAPGSWVSQMMEKCSSLDAQERAIYLESDQTLESAYEEVELRGNTEPPDPEDEVDFHYVCFVKSHEDGRLYELDGDRKGPVDWGVLGPEEDVLSELALRSVRQFIQRVGLDLGFSLLALAPES
ncbi:ubiquitin carboxyl-terminal hydrolase, family 1 [Xylariomycetidae sp. FL2044]|nr:ubiquitin carboxyl-terminal hydrolase, family 1 [Xylariomycetidae sp. FL2044]